VKFLLVVLVPENLYKHGCDSDRGRSAILSRTLRPLKGRYSDEGFSLVWLGHDHWSKVDSLKSLLTCVFRNQWCKQGRLEQESTHLLVCSGQPLADSVQGESGDLVSRW
jgi:hypothetical protein